MSVLLGNVVRLRIITILASPANILYKGYYSNDKSQEHQHAEKDSDDNFCNVHNENNLRLINRFTFINIDKNGRKSRPDLKFFAQKIACFESRRF